MLEAPAPGVPVGGVQRALVRTAQVTVQVGDPAVGSRQIRTAVAAAGGFVTEEQSSSTGAWVVLRVPAAGLDRLVEQIGGFGTVVEQSSQVVDTTEETVDLDARVVSQQASVTRIRWLIVNVRVRPGDSPRSPITPVVEVLTGDQRSRRRSRPSKPGLRWLGA